MIDHGTPSASGTQEIPRYEFGSTIVDLTHGAGFNSILDDTGNQAVERAKGGQPAIAVWNDAGFTDITERYPLVTQADLDLLISFFGVSGVNVMESNFNFYPNANKPSTVYSVRLRSAKGFTFKPLKSGSTRKIYSVIVRMRVEVP